MRGGGLAASHAATQDDEVRDVTFQQAAQCFEVGPSLGQDNGRAAIGHGGQCVIDDLAVPGFILGQFGAKRPIGGTRISGLRRGFRQSVLTRAECRGASYFSGSGPPVSKSRRASSRSSRRRAPSRRRI